MTDTANVQNMAIFCDFENVALGVQEARYEAFDMQKVLERLLLKGNIIAKKAYSDWDRYRKFKPAMHEAGFELIEIPHVRQSGKNSADIRMVVDALDLCFTKPHVDGFVIVSGDSDFSPLVSKLRENNRIVIGVGVKQSTSNLLTASCDEFIYYDDLVRRAARKAPKKTAKKSRKKNGAKKAPTDSERKIEAVDLVMATLEDLFSDRGEQKVWGSMVKQTLKRRRPDFDESYHGFRSFSELLEFAAGKKLLTLERDERSGGQIITQIRDNGA